MHNDTAILILAAGSSSRLGHPKQLVCYENEPLLRRSVKMALALSPHVFVVLGHAYDACLATLEDLHVNTLYHEAYAKGMGSSLSFGIAHTLSFSQTLIMLCDQPFIPLSHYHSLLAFTCKDKMVASRYDEQGKLGVPALFPYRYYEALMHCDGDKGAQMLLKKEPCDFIVLQEGWSIDIDTEEDVKTYL